MKTILLFLITLVVYSYGETALTIHKGWQLIGLTTKTNDLKMFPSSHVEQIWKYNAFTQDWEGYSFDPTISKKIKDNGYNTINSIESWQGFWIKSKDEWTLTLPDNQLTDENITLQKGWNLISLPVNSVISPHVFDGHTVWKYAKKDGWKLFDTKKNKNYSTLQKITNADGIWVKSDKKQTISTLTDSAKLHNFKELKELTSYIKNMLLTHKRPWIGYYPLTVEPPILYDTNIESIQTPSQQKADNTSQTNIQEEGVDEADIVKHDQQYIYYLSQTRDQSTVNINTFTRISNNQTKPISTIQSDGYVKNIYTFNQKLIILSHGKNRYTNLPLPQKRDSAKSNFFQPYSLVEIYDVSNPTSATLLSSFKIDGNLIESRLIKGKLYFISQFNPYIETTYPKIYVNAPECKNFFNSVQQVQSGVVTTQINNTTMQNETTKKTQEDYKKYSRCYSLQQDSSGKFFKYDYDNPKITNTHLIPYYQRDHEDKKMLISPQTLYVSDKIDQQPVITTVSQIDTENTKLEKTTSIVGYNNTIYASKKALYLVSTQYPYFYQYNKYKERSAIYRLTLDKNLQYDSFGFVEGKPLNQFSLSEFNGYLRIATTKGNSWQNNTQNSLYTLKPIEHKLILQGKLTGLGKEGETIQAVRFLGNKGYVVTFKRTDPFYTLDLADPLNPQKAGELKINGYSSYLHPIGENLILGFGRNATNNGQVLGLKVELFDISNIQKPQAVDSYTLKGYTSSEIEWNHKALSYRENDNIFAFPYTVVNNGKSQNLLDIFQIKNNKIIDYQPPLKAATNTNYLNRGLIFDLNQETYIAYFTNGSINYTKLSQLTKEAK